MKKMNSSIIIIFITVLIILAIGYFYLNPSLKLAWQNYQEIKKSQDTLNEISQKKAILEKFSKNKQLTEAYNIASSYIPEQEDSGDLVIGLSEIAKQSNLKVEQISFDKQAIAKSNTASSSNDTTNSNAPNAPATEPNDKTEAKEVEFAMKVSGTFGDFLSFIQNLEKSNRLVTINSMDLTQASDKGFSASLQGKAYYLKTTDLDTSLTAIDISQDIITKFKNLKTFGQPINLQTESGFGRPDPFSTY